MLLLYRKRRQKANFTGRFEDFFPGGYAFGGAEAEIAGQGKEKGVFVRETEYIFKKGVDKPTFSVYNRNMLKNLYDNYTGEESGFPTTLSYRHEGQTLYFTFDCFRSKKFSAYVSDNDPLFLGDVAEVFICTGDDLSRYYEIEVAPNGAVFFAAITNDGKNVSTDFPERHFKAEVVSLDRGYRVILEIPDAELGVTDVGKIRFNAFRIETEGGTPEKNLLALNPTLCGKFHLPEFFIPWTEN